MFSNIRMNYNEEIYERSFSLFIVMHVNQNDASIFTKIKTMNVGFLTLLF